MTALATAWWATVVHAVRTLLRRRRARREAAAFARWAAAHPHLVALHREVGPTAAAMLAATVPDAALRRAWAEHREREHLRRVGDALRYWQAHPERAGLLVGRVRDDGTETWEDADGNAVDVTAQGAPRKGA